MHAGGFESLRRCINHEGIKKCRPLVEDGTCSCSMQWYVTENI